MRRGNVVELSVDTHDVDAIWGVDGRFCYLGRGTDPELHAVQGHRPVLEDERFGHFTVDEDHNSFVAETDWLGHPVELMLCTDAWRPIPIDHARRIFDKAPQWDVEARELAATKLLGVKNECWRGDEAPLTTEQFAEMIKLSPIVAIKVEAGGLFEFYFDGGDLFKGHLFFAAFNEETGEHRAAVST